MKSIPCQASGVCSIKWLGVLSLSLDESPSQGAEALWESSVSPKSTTHWPRPGLEPGPFDLASSALFHEAIAPRLKSTVPWCITRAVAPLRQVSTWSQRSLKEKVQRWLRWYGDDYEPIVVEMDFSAIGLHRSYGNQFPEIEVIVTKINIYQTAPRHYLIQVSSALFLFCSDHVETGR